MFLPKSPLFDEATEGNSGGGGAAVEEHAEGAGEGQHQESQPPQTPALTLDVLKDLLKAQSDATTREFTKQINGLDAKYKKQFEQKKEAPKTEAMTAEQMLAEYKRESEERIAAIEQEREVERKTSQQKEMDIEIKSALSDGFQWNTDAKGVAEGKDVAFSFYRAQAQRDEDGKLVIGGMPIQAYIKEDAARRFKPFHSARNVGGSGNSGNKGSAPPTIMNETLFKKTRSGQSLTDDEKSAVLSDVRAQIAAQFGR